MSLKTEDAIVEQSLLFSVFKYGEPALKEIIRVCEPRDFVCKPYRFFYEHIIHQFKDTKHAPSFTGFTRYVTTLPDTEEKDRLIYKEALSQIEKNPIALKDTQMFAKQLREYAAKRLLISSMNNSINNMETGHTIPEIITDLTKNVYNVQRRLSLESADNIIRLKGDTQKRVDYMKVVIDDPVNAGLVETSFDNFDKAGVPPLSPGSLAILQARVNTGKSMFLMRVALHNYHRRLKVIIITIEMAAIDYVMRMDSNISEIKHINFTTGEVATDTAKSKKWLDAIQAYGNPDVDLIVYRVPEKCTAEKIDMIIQTNEFKPDLVCVDYAGNMDADLKGTPNLSPAAQGKVFSELKALAGKHNCVIYTAQQVKRGVSDVDIEEGEGITEAGAWAAEAINIADLVIIFYHSDIDKLKGTIAKIDGSFGDDTTENKNPFLTARIAKIRNGVYLRTYLYKRFDKMTAKEFSFWKEGKKILDSGDVVDIDPEIVKKYNEPLWETKYKSQDVENMIPGDGMVADVDIGRIEDGRSSDELDPISEEDAAVGSDDELGDIETE